MELTLKAMEYLDLGENGEGDYNLKEHNKVKITPND